MAGVTTVGIKDLIGRIIKGISKRMNLEFYVVFLLIGFGVSRLCSEFLWSISQNQVQVHFIIFIIFDVLIVS